MLGVLLVILSLVAGAIIYLVESILFWILKVISRVALKPILATSKFVREKLWVIGLVKLTLGIFVQIRCPKLWKITGFLFAPRILKEPQEDQ